MISIADYDVMIKGEFRCVLGREEVPCPCCGGKLHVYGTCIRKVREADGTHKYRLRVLRCRGCGKFHRELPDSIIPYKRAGLAAFCETVQAKSDQYSCEESTWRRMRSWMERFLTNARFVERSLICSGLLPRTGEPGDSLARQMEYYVRLVVNSGNWVHNRSAMTVP